MSLTILRPIRLISSEAGRIRLSPAIVIGDLGEAANRARGHHGSFENDKQQDGEKLWLFYFITARFASDSFTGKNKQ
jgi:hypothetical protein